jgi:hypothetical protein
MSEESTVEGRRKLLVVKTSVGLAVAIVAIGLIGMAQADRTTETQRTSWSTIASGERNGEHWALRGYVGDVQTSLGTRRSLCLNWRGGSGDDGDVVCTVDLPTGLPAGHHLVSDTSASPYFGEVSREVATVELRLDSGQMLGGQIYEAPAAWGLNFSFFVAFAPDSESVTILARDPSGQVLDQTVHESLPELLVKRAGSGSGTVVGSSGQQTFIDCGEHCAAEVDGGTITMEATAAPGSIFGGWSGACAGLGKCSVTMGSDDRAVTATFLESPS